MTTLVAIHEIHRPGEDGKTEVIAPGKKFKATDAEVSTLVEQFGAARLLTDADGAPLAKSAEGTVAPVDLSKLTKAQLIELAAKEEITLVDGSTNADMVKAIEAGRAAKADII